MSNYNYNLYQNSTTDKRFKLNWIYLVKAFTLFGQNVFWLQRRIGKAIQSCSSNCKDLFIQQDFKQVECGKVVVKRVDEMAMRCTGTYEELQHLDQIISYLLVTVLFLSLGKWENLMLCHFSNTVQNCILILTFLFWFRSAIRYLYSCCYHRIAIFLIAGQVLNFRNIAILCQTHHIQHLPSRYT